MSFRVFAADATPGFVVPLGEFAAHAAFDVLIRVFVSTFCLALSLALIAKFVRHTASTAPKRRHQPNRGGVSATLQHGPASLQSHCSSGATLQH